MQTIWLAGDGQHPHFAEALAWLGEQPEVTYLMGANTYRLMSGFAAGEPPAGQEESSGDEETAVDEQARSDCVGDAPSDAGVGCVGPQAAGEIGLFRLGFV